MAYQRYCNDGPAAYNSTPAPRRIEVKQRNPYCTTKPMYQSPQQINARRSTNVFDKFMAMGPVQAITCPPQIDKKLLCCFWFRLIEMLGCLICFILGVVLICKTDNRMYKYFFTGVSCMYLLICIFDLIGYSMNKTIPCLYTWILFTTLGYLLFISAAGLAVIPNAMHWEEYVILVFAIITAIVFLADLIQACRKTHLESLRDDDNRKIHPEQKHYAQDHGGQGHIYGTGQARDPCCFQQEIRPCYKKPVPPPPPPPPPPQEEEKPDPCCFQQEIRPCYKPAPPPMPKQELCEELPDPCCFEQEIRPCYKSPPKQEEPVEEPKQDICERSGDTIYLCVDESGQACYKKKEKPRPEKTYEKQQSRHDDPVIYLCVDDCGQPCYKIKESCEEAAPPECPPPPPPRPPSCDEPRKHQNIIICVDECGKPCYKFVDEDYTTETQTRNVLYEQDENVPYYRRQRCDDRERNVLKEQGRNSPMKRAHSPEVNESFSQGKMFSSIPIVLATNDAQKPTYPTDPVVSQSMRIKQTINSTNRSKVCAALKHELSHKSRERCTGPFVSKKMKEDENCLQVNEIIQQNINEIKKSLLERCSKEKIEKIFSLDKTDKIESPSKATSKDESPQKKEESNKELTLVYKSIETFKDKNDFKPEPKQESVHSETKEEPKRSETKQESVHSETKEEPKRSETKQESVHSETNRESAHSEPKRESAHSEPQQESKHSEHLETVEPESSPVIESKSEPVTPTTTPRDQSDRTSLPGTTDTEEKRE